MAQTFQKRLRALVLGLILVGVALEGGGRLYLQRYASMSRFTKYAPPSWVPIEWRIYRAHPYLSYSLNEYYRSRDGLNRHNAYGYRGDDLTLAKPAGAYRVLVLGGSTTYETGVADYHRSFTVQLQELLRERTGRADIEVINAGCGGWSSWESLIDLELRGLALSPDLVVVYCGTNDVHTRLVPHAAYRRDNTGFRTPWNDDEEWWEHSVVLRRIGILVGAARRNDVSSRSEIDYGDLDFMACLDANSTEYYEDNVAQMVALSRRRGAEVMVASWAWCPDFEGDYASRPHYQRGFAEVNEASKRVGEREGVAFYDHVAQMPKERKYWADGRHVNAEGARVKAELFADFIAPRFLKSR